MRAVLVGFVTAATVDVRDVLTGLQMARTARTVDELRGSLAPLGLPWAIVELIVAHAVIRQP